MISIAQKMMPFSHLPGISLLIPGTFYAAEIFPALVRIYKIGHEKKELVKEQEIPIKGPLKNFMVTQDLERGCLAVRGENLTYFILPTLDLIFSKNPKMELRENMKRLSLGSHKKMEWEKIKARFDCAEIFPLWHRLSAFLPFLPPRHEKKGIFSLLEECHQALFGKPEHLLEPFKRLFLAGFEGMFVPRLADDEHQGILQEVVTGENPFYLLKEGAELIESLFIRSKKEEIEILPMLPPQFFAGRLLNISLPQGIFHLEWSKKMVRRVQFKAHHDGSIQFIMPSSVKDFRLRTNLREKGMRYQWNEPVEIKSGSNYLLDRFQK